jgi:hypothetical protein
MINNNIPITIEILDKTARGIVIISDKIPFDLAIT